ncbi:MAG TPA: hypothetical protein P5119_00050 [Candidatus Aminicenantes bacterium]|nr:hypothetical protein [Candidatus Aminicenantes bacterium]HRY63715.1 hypothetical protein [Candidatus Aminicenantes bacterium]HRZ73253.1 hypothetical protein [Candidatus Aminicenantes bacterium]
MSGPDRTPLRTAGAALVMALALAAGLAAQAGSGQPAAQAPAWDGHRTIPAHLIPLRDENDEPIIPTEAQPLPYSARYTCGPCHDYGTIRGGWHFGAMTAAASGRPGEPWLEVDARTGTILPLSYRRWAGTFDPRAVGLTAWDFTLLFGRHLPGGGPAEPSDAEVEAEPDARWSVSGKAEINCLACHNGSGRQDPGEWAKQVLRENLRWAATAAAGLGEVGGMASRLKGTWDVFDGPNPDDHEWAVVPEVRYRPSDFDSKHRYFFDLNYQPSDERCLACHAVSPKDEPKWAADADVHAAAGLKCADCHRNDLGHAMVRGYEAEASETGNKTAAAFTCRGCHLGEDAEGGKTVVPGRLGAPYPRHTGIPLVHFKRLACTVCHSGPRPKEGFTRVRTARANRLGIHGVAAWATDAPIIVEPVYREDGAGKISPQRLVWPAYWARRTGKDLLPIKPAEVEAAAGDILKPEDRIARVLIGLSQVMAEDETPVLEAGRFVFAPNVDAGLDAAGPTGGKADAPARWGIRKDGGIVPLVPDFDPAAEDKDPAVEARFQEFLQALATVAEKPGEPAILVRRTLYRLVDGFLDVSEAPAGLAGAAGPGWIAAGKLLPLASDFDVRTVTAKAGTEQTLTEEQVALVLAALTKAGATGECVYISGGRLFRLEKGRLAARKDRAAEPLTWPLAHNVRPAQQSLGWKACTDCHSGASDFFFDTIKGTGPLLTKSVARLSTSSFMGRGGLFQRIFGLTFLVRPVLKIVLAVCAFLVGPLLLVAGLAALGRFAGFLGRR